MAFKRPALQTAWSSNSVKVCGSAIFDGNVHNGRIAQKIEQPNAWIQLFGTLHQAPATMPIGRLHILTDIHLQQQFSHVELARLACAGGADVIQFRQKKGTIPERLAMLLDVAAVCKASGVQLIVDDHLDLALAVGADGFHVGQDDLPVETARAIIEHHDGSTCLIGATCTTTEQARHAASAGADYIGFGPVFPTTSKANPASVKGLAGLAEVCTGVAIPVVAIGGITVERVRSVLEAGAHGVAVMSAVVMAEEPERAVRLFRREIDQIK